MIEQTRGVETVTPWRTRLQSCRNGGSDFAIPHSVAVQAHKQTTRIGGISSRQTVRIRPAVCDQ
ncbi:hypothetical protein [Cupriavidus sp. amp6]|uniref:hypothetical protein n=1 Tax=Cupriavidus sp. amp6 TaxID=388051 RepID=UPI0012EC6922|nr:hypothetical protein [Cupriavidus sp. amp6]